MGSWYLVQIVNGSNHREQRGGKSGMRLILLELVALCVQAGLVDEDVGVGGDARHRAADMVADLGRRELNIRVARKRSGVGERCRVRHLAT